MHYVPPVQFNVPLEKIHGERICPPMTLLTAGVNEFIFVLMLIQTGVNTGLFAHTYQASYSHSVSRFRFIYIYCKMGVQLKRCSCLRHNLHECSLNDH